MQTRIRILESTLAMLRAADRQGVGLGPTWDGTSPAVPAGDVVMGWNELALLLEAAATCSGTGRDRTISRSFLSQMRQMTPLIPQISATSVEETPRIEHARRTVMAKLRTVAGTMAIFGGMVDKAKARAEARVGHPVPTNNAVFLSEVANTFFLDPPVRDALMTVDLYAFTITRRARHILETVQNQIDHEVITSTPHETHT